MTYFGFFVGKRFTRRLGRPDSSAYESQSYVSYQLTCTHFEMKETEVPSQSHDRPNNNAPFSTSTSFNLSVRVPKSNIYNCTMSAAWWRLNFSPIRPEEAKEYVLFESFH